MAVHDIQELRNDETPSFHELHEQLLRERPELRVTLPYTGEIPPRKATLPHTGKPPNIRPL